MAQQATANQQENRLIEVVRGLTAELHEGRGYEPVITLDSGLDRDLGLDSLARVELLTRIERRFAVHLSEKLLAQVESPRDLLRAVLAAGPTGQGPSAVQEDKATVTESVAEASDAQTLQDVLDWHARIHPQQLHITLYDEGDIGEEITFLALREGAEAVACGLQYSGIEPGQTVALMLPTSQDYFVSFLGVLLAGAVPVPLYPPARPAQIEEHLRRHSTILSNSLATLLITIAEVKPLARLLKAQVVSLKGAVTVTELCKRGSTFTPHWAKSADTAFLQYTSGSTGNPKGVVLSHANLLANIRAMGEAVQASSRDVFVSWLPLYHDMGLIGAWLGSLYFGSRLVIMSPLAFLVHPESWLWAIHRHRGTLSAAPNFGYEFCMKKIDDRDLEGLDLSSWRLAFNGAEPVSPETVINFPARFKRYGFSAKAMTPVYGLAESSVGLAFPTIGSKPRIDRVQREPFMALGRAVPAAGSDDKGLRFVGCGHPLKGHKIRIVNDSDTELGERQEGILQFIGPSVTSGYFRNLEQTKTLFHDTWLDSGDMAYMADGEVFLTSRVKDIIIKGGRNIYPYELEEAVAKISGIRKGCVAVFGSQDAKSGTERLVVLAETRQCVPEKLNLLHRDINSSVIDLLGIPADQILLVEPHTLLKTSSGKLRRAATREKYEQGRLAKGSRAVWWQIVRVAMAGLIPQMVRGLKRLQDCLYAGYCWGLLALFSVPLWLLVVLLPEDLRWTVLRHVARLLIGLTRTPLVVKGLDNLPKQPVVLVANHMSYLDSFILVAALPLQVRFVAKAELQKKFLLRIFLTAMDVEFVDRFDAEQGVAAARRIDQSGVLGKSLLFFPEGTLHRIAGLLPFHMGAFTAAAQAAMPVVPLTIRGTRQKLRSGSWFPRQGLVSLEIGKSIRAKGADWSAAVALRDAARQEILRHCGEPNLAGTRPPVREKNHD